MADHLSTFTFLDYSNEKSNVRIYNGAITPASLAGYLTEFGALRTALDGITLGTIHKEAWIGDDTLLSNSLPASPLAQRELKWLVTYRDTTSQNLYTITIPTADPTGRLVPGTDLADLTEAGMAAFVTAFEQTARSPEADTHNVEVMTIRLVGRNI